MESQMAHAHGHGKTHEQEPRIVGHHAEGEDEHHHEKKSVLNKVKAKARKIKDTLTKHGHGHNHDHIPDDNDVDEKVDDEEEMVDDPEIHGAPMYEAAAIKSIGQVDSGVDTGRSTAMEVDPRVPNVNPDEGLEIDVLGREASKGQQRVNLGLTTIMGEVSGAPQNTPESHTTPGIHQTRDNDPTGTFVPSQEERPGQQKVNLQGLIGLEEDPDAPKDTPSAYTANYQTKVTDPSGKGGEEAGITTVLHSFDKMEIYDESKPKSGLEQSFPTGTQDFLTSVPTGTHDQFSPELTPPQRISIEDYPQENIDDSPSNQSDRFSSELTPSQRLSTEGYPQENKVDRPSNQGSYTEKISSATSAIADKAVSAKNVVTSKLGYGQKDNTRGDEMQGGDKNAMPASVVDYGKKMTATVTEKLTPVYEKVAGAGSTVMSKMHGTGTGIVTGNEQERGVEGQDKGVSVKDYFAEKLRPGEEDRALSEVISEALHKRKVEQEKPATSRPVSEVISDALDKRKDEMNEKNMPVGKVTESEEVARRLGTDEHDSSKPRMDSSYVNNNSGNGVVDKIKGTVDSWFGRAEVSRGSQQSLGSSFSSPIEGAGQDSSLAGERRLQESGN